MSPHLEAQLEAVIQRRVRLAGGMIFKLAPTVKGMPDRLVVLPGGRMYLVELKTTSGKLSPAQLELHYRLRTRVGVEVVVLKGVDEIQAWLNDRAKDFDPARRRPGRPRKLKEPHVHDAMCDAYCPAPTPA